MGRGLVLLAAFVAGVALVVFIAVSDDEGGGDGQGPTIPAAARTQPERCPAPRVTDLRVRPVSEDRERIALHGRAYVERGGIGAIEVSWGDRHAVIADMWVRRQAVLRFLEHRYPHPGAYRISVTAGGSAGNCPYKKSEPATLRVRIPLTTRDPSSP